MDEFFKALVSEDKNDLISAEYDWYSPLIGEWDFDYYSGDNHVEGEWIFRRVLEGMAIEDLFICPSRATKESNPQPDGEYGVAIRMFNVQNKCYDMTYVCSRYTQLLEVRKENGKIVCTVKNNPHEKWVFSEITSQTFRWQNITVLNSGEWRINSDIYARRK